MCVRPGAVIPLAQIRGITPVGHPTLCCIIFCIHAMKVGHFCQTKNPKTVRLSRVHLRQSDGRIFDLSGLNLTSEGLLLGASLHVITECTRSDPCRSCSRIPNIFDYAKDMVVMICRELKVPASSMRRLGGVALTISRRFSGPHGTRQLVIGLSTTVL
jgi:hypothetical protein